MNGNESVTYQNLWDMAKAALRGNFIIINTYIKEKERSQINNQSLHFKELIFKRTN